LLFYPIVGILLSLLIAFLAQNLDWFNDIEKITFLAKDFLLLIGFSLIPVMVFQVFKQFMEGLSSTKEAMFINISTTIINIFLNYLLIFGKFGFPEWGLFGAGVATFIARFVSPFLLIFIFLKRKKFEEYKVKLIVFQKELFLKLAKIGFPIGLQMVFESGAFAFSAIMIGWIGEIPLAAHQIALNVGTATFLTTTGISAAASVRVAHFRGLGEVQNMRRAGLSAVLLGAIFMGICGIVILSFNNYIPTLYVSEYDLNQAELQQIASSLLILVAIFQLSDGTQVVAIGTLRGLEDVKVPTIITLLAYWVTGIPVGYFFGFVLQMGVQGVWFGLISSLSVAAIVLSVRFLIISKRKLHE